VNVVYVDVDVVVYVSYLFYVHLILKAYECV
jgi:hypothetical protein